MPVSPFQRAVDEGIVQGDGRSLAGSGKAKRKAKPTDSRKNRKKKIKAKYAKAREDAQLAGLIPTTPDGAIKPECVDASAQGEQHLPQLTGQAIRKGWAVPEERKPDLVDELIRILDDPEVPQKVKVAAFNALRQADQSQYERDHPEAAGTAKGGGRGGVVNVSVQTNVTAVELLNKMLDDPSAGIADLAPLTVTGAPGDSGHRGEVEASAALASDQQGAGEGVANAE